MAADRTSSIDFTGLEETFDWLKSKKNLVVGAALVVALLWATFTFIGRQQEEAQREPWRALFGANSDPWDTPPDELAKLLADPKVAGSPAEPYVLYWLALRQQEAKDSQGALASLAAFKTRFGKSALVLAKLPGAGMELQTAVDRLETEIHRLQRWEAEHPLPAANPPPTGTTVTLVTERGNVVIGIYNDQAPKSCEAFLKVATALKDQFIAKTSPDKWIELGQNEAGTPIETQAFTEGFPPFEQNTLWHFTGAVSFRQPPFTKGPFNPDLRVALASDFNEDSRSTVFGQVTEGIDLLVTLSKDPRKADNPQLFEKPIKITDVLIGGAAPAPVPPPGQ